MRRGRGRQFEKLVLGAVALAVSALLWMQLLQLGGPNFLSSFSEFSSYPGVEDRRLRKNKDDRGGNDAAAACRVFLQRFHAMNECFRSWLQPCPHQEYTNKQITKAEPLLFYAMMSGQGVGRLMDHAVGTALLAYALQRPFMMDLAWDPHGVLRFLVNAGSYQWYYQDDGGPRHQQWLKLHQTNVTKAINALADKGHNGWVNLPTDLPDILPMSGLYNITNIDKKDLFDPHYRALYTNRAFHEWRRTRDHQILLSPNWGDAWMGNIQLNATQHLDNCPLERATAAVQNALWAPTAALRALFAARRQQVLGTEQQKQSSFGAIHFRTHFMRKELIPPSNKEKVTEEENQRLAEAMADVLEDCATRLADAVTTWWILSDSDEMARAMLAKVQDRQQQLTAAHATNSNGSTTNSTLERFSFLYRSMEGGKHTRVGKRTNNDVVTLSSTYVSTQTIAS